MTVFLTTQYLEEADVLADRVGIIDHGTIVAEGTPEKLKAEIGASDGRGGARRPRRSAEPSRRVLERFGEPDDRLRPRQRRRAAAVGDGDLAGDRARPRRRRCRPSSQLQIHEPTLDDVFLAKTGRHLEGAGDEEEPEPELEPSRRV